MILTLGLFSLITIILIKLPMIESSYAAGDLTIDWGVAEPAPIFYLTSFLPGDTEARDVSVTNNASSTKPVGIRVTEVAETSNLSDVIEITIFADGNPIYGEGSPTGIRTYSDFVADSTDPDGIFLTDIDSTQTVIYTISAHFREDSDNQYQNSQFTFDLTIGVSVTIPEICTEPLTGNIIFGTEGNDNLRGTSKNDLMLGFEGNDKIDGGSGNDCIIGGTGDDNLKGGSGSDSITADEGADIVDGGSGTDIISGGNGNDKLAGGSASDQILGEGDADSLDGGSGNDSLDGGDGIDSSNGGSGRDTCSAETKSKCEL